MPTSTVKTTCCYCGVGCGVLIDTVNGEVTGVRGDPDHPANRGQLCTKGSALHLTTGRSGRLLHPEVRTQREMRRERATWDAALEHTADHFAAAIREHGPDAVAFYVSGQLLTEDYYAFNKLARAVVGTNNIDSNSRLCMSSAVAGYKATLGADGPPACYDDIDAADCLLIAGSNTAWAHPVLFRRIEAARARRPDVKLIVIDPRRTATAAAADLHLAIEPGTDVALFNGMLHVLMWENLVDTAYIDRHTEGYDALRSLVRDYPPRDVARICGISEEDLVTAARGFGRARAALSLYCMGLNQSSHGTDKNTALINLHLATGHIGKPGAGPFSLTGQPNAMGGREVGAMANLYSGHRDVTSDADRAEVGRFWGLRSLTARPGRTAVEMFEALRSGEIKCVWIACTNPAHSMPDQAMVHEALQRADLVVLQDAYAGTETAAYADVLLPATTWAEKNGTMTNSERRVSRVRPAVAAPGEARHDWQIAAHFARRLEQRLRPGLPALLPYTTPEQIHDEHRWLTRGRDLDIAALSYEILDTRGPQQWPFRNGAAQGRARLYEDGVFATPSGRARFVAAPYRPVAEAIDARFPFRLITARLRDQWHGMSRTGRAARLYGHAGEPSIGVHPADLARRGLHAGQLVHVESRRGRVTLAVEADDSVQPGTASLPMHWGARLLGGADAAGVNALTLPACDPVSHQPELKHCGVRITPAKLEHRLVAFASARDADAVRLLSAASELLRRFQYAHCVMLSGVEAGVLLRVADARPIAKAMLDVIDELFRVNAHDTLRYDDPRLGVGRRVRIADDRIVSVRLSGDTAPEAWLKELFVSGKSVAAMRRMLLAPAMPASAPSRGRIVCSCRNVAQTEIESSLSRHHGGDALEALQHELKCGTQCGSCVPEVRQLIAASAAASPDINRAVA